MRAYLARRLLLLIPTLLGVLTLVFFLLHFVPGDPVIAMLGERSSQADQVLLRQQLGLDQPIGVQYSRYIRQVVSGNLGQSIHRQRPVAQLVRQRMGPTIILAIASMLIAVCIAFPLGIIAALRRSSWWDHSALFVSLIGVSMPNFWLGPLLILLFSIYLDWFPVSGMQGASSIVLPALTLGTALAAILARIIRSNLLEVLNMDYVNAARSKGLAEKRVVLKHAMRNAMLPVITIIGLQFGVLLSGAIITEHIFNWPGLGSLLIDGIRSRDYPIVQGCILMIAFSYVIINLLTDIMYAVIDPRIRYA